MTFELNIKCSLQHSATSNHFEMNEIEWSEKDKPIIITVNCFRQLQLEIWRRPIKQGSQELTTLLSILHEYTVFPNLLKTNTLTSHLVKRLLQHW